MGVIIYAASRGCSSHIHKIATLWAGKQHDFHQDRRKYIYIYICFSENWVSQSHGLSLSFSLVRQAPSTKKRCQVVRALAPWNHPKHITGRPWILHAPNQQYLRRDFFRALENTSLFWYLLCMCTCNICNTCSL